jgi:glycosyltransferase involved in cell wall biosynthesis
MTAARTTRRVVVSAVNFTEGGPLTVLRDCLRAAAVTLPDEWEIVALVHDASLVQEPRVRLMTFPQAKASWTKRLALEWFGFARHFRGEPVDLWLSLHDVTPRVEARRQAVYCHNPSPFYRLPLHEARLEPKLWLFNRFYAQLYGTFISRNHWVIVQQEWIRRAFTDRFGPLPVVVAHPDVKLSTTDVLADQPFTEDVPYVLLYPTLPRVFKNIETVMAAMQRLADKCRRGVELRVTISGDENPYARWLYQRFHSTPGVNFIGRQSATEMVQQYRSAHAVIFPSKLETWGLPITEAKAWNKPLLVADLPYARETVGSYTQVVFVPATDIDAWMHEFKSIALGNWTVLPTIGVPVPEPYSPSWSALWKRLVTGL